VSAGTGIALFVAAIFVMIVVHEFGHYSTARMFGIKVEQFFIGFGPKVLSWRRGETEYGLKAILLGGYVRIAGMNPFETVPEEEFPRTFGAKPAWQRAIVLVAGSATHLILGFLIMVVVFASVGLPGFFTRLAYVDPGSPAQAAGLRVGDRVRSVDGKEIATFSHLRDIVVDSPGKPLSIVVERDGEEVTLTATPEPATDLPEGAPPQGRLGLRAADKETVGAAVPAALRYTGQYVVGSITGIGKVLSPSGVGNIFKSLAGEGERAADQPISLIGGGREAGRAASAGEFGILLTLIANIIIFVGVINLAPLPPLDGGHLLLLLIEKVRGGRAVDARKVVPVAAVVLTFFLILTVALVYLDIARPIRSPF
jgi:membrane-associated protease RseP (regulator of RpoE activity)